MRNGCDGWVVERIGRSIARRAVPIPILRRAPMKATNLVYAALGSPSRALSRALNMSACTG
jgi:hypothetical protein